MTFTVQNFTRLPFLNIRQPVLSLGPICHLSWAPELSKKKKTHADGKAVPDFYFVAVFLSYRKSSLAEQTVQGVKIF